MSQIMNETHMIGLHIPPPPPPILTIPSVLDIEQLFSTFAYGRMFSPYMWIATTTTTNTTIKRVLAMFEVCLDECLLWWCAFENK